MKSLLFGLLVWTWGCIGIGSAVLADRQGADARTQFVAFAMWPVMIPFAIHEATKK